MKILLFRIWSQYTLRNSIIEERKIMYYRRATSEDIAILIESRVELLREANRLDVTEPLNEIRERTHQYYIENLDAENHIAILAFQDTDSKEQFVGTGAVCFYNVLPTCHNPSGRKAYIINMYTKPEFRKQGVGSKILDLLLKECEKKNVNFITLEATGKGRTLYEKHGFLPVTREMQLNNITYEKELY